MADLYSQVIRGDGVSTYTVGGNNRRTRPSSEFGTPRITTVILDTEGETLPNNGLTYWSDDTDAENLLTTGDFQSANSDVFRAVQAIQQYCEVYQVGGTADSNYLPIAVRDSSIPYDDGTTFVNVGSTITKLQTAVRAALGGALVTVKVGVFRDDDLDS
jgi:hypothetical protein